MAGRERDDLAEEPLVHAAENVRRHHSELVRTLRVIQRLDDPFQRFVVHVQRGRKRVRGFIAVFLFGEVEQPRVVPGIGVAEELAQPRINGLAA